MHYSKVKPCCSTFRVITANFRESEFLGFLRYASLNGLVKIAEQVSGGKKCMSVEIFLNMISLEWFNLPHDETNKMTCAPSEDSDQPGHLPSLIRVFAVCIKRAWVLSYRLRAQRRFWSDWRDAQAGLSLRWAHTHFVGFVMSRLIYRCQWMELFHLFKSGTCI